MLVRLCFQIHHSKHVKVLEYLVVVVSKSYTSTTLLFSASGKLIQDLLDILSVDEHSTRLNAISAGTNDLHECKRL